MNTIFEEQWKNNFSTQARELEDEYAVSGWTKEGLAYYTKYFVEYIAPHLRKREGGTALDVGCGPGYFSKLLADYNYTVSGVDYAEGMVALAREKIRDPRITFRVGDIYQLPFEDNHFDVVTCLGVLQHTEDSRRAVEEMWRVTKPGGVVCITTLNQFSILSLVRRKDDVSLMRYNPFEFKGYFGKNFDNVSLKGIYIFPPWIGFLGASVLRLKLYKVLNLLFPITCVAAHSFHITLRKKQFEFRVR